MQPQVEEPPAEEAPKAEPDSKAAAPPPKPAREGKAFDEKSVKNTSPRMVAKQREEVNSRIGSALTLLLAAPTGLTPFSSLRGAVQEDP